MKNGTTIWTAALATLAYTSSAGAHHSGYMYATTPIWVKGSVVRFEQINPHTIITLEEKSADGQVRRWAVEGPPQSGLDRRGGDIAVPKVGDTLRFCAFPYKSAAEIARDPRIRPPVDPSARRPPPAADGSSPQFVAGHVMVMPDGKKQLWEPHGVIGECVRSSDEQRQSWLDFINSSPGARLAWCDQLGYAHAQSNASLRELVEEIDSSLAQPCK